MSLPTTLRRRDKWLSTTLSCAGRMCVAPSPESTTAPELRPGCEFRSFHSASETQYSLTLKIKSEYRLDSNVDTPELIPLKHNLTHFLPVAQRVHERLGEQDLAASGIYLKFLAKRVPDVVAYLPIF